MAECLKVKIVESSSGPQAQRVDRLAAVGDDRAIKWNADQSGWPARDNAQTPATYLEGGVQLDFDSLVRACNLPGVLTTQPVVRPFLLPAVPDRLFEHPVFVPQAVTDCRELHRRHRVEETCGQTSKSPVAEAGVRFFLQQPEPINIVLLYRLLHDGIEQKVGHIVCE